MTDTIKTLLNATKKDKREAVIKPAELLTFTLRSGQVALAKMIKGKIYAISYTNVRQANAKVDKLRLEGVNCYRTMTHPFYIIIAEEQHVE